MDSTTVIDRQADPRWMLQFLLVLALAALLLFARLSERALWSEEVRWAQIPREMQQSGNYLWPTINGRTYYDKPLGSYWLVLIASLFTSGVNETSARLPSACAGLAAVAFTMLIGRRLFDGSTALWAGVILATSFSFVFFARTASTDAETVAGTLAACWIFLRNESKPPGWWTVLLWLVMALTSLTKGLLGFVLPILIIGLYATLAQGRPVSIRAFTERNRWFFNRWTSAGIPLAATVYLGPFLLSIALGGGTDGLEMVYRENIRRFFDPLNHRGPIYLYVGVIFVLLAPWSLLLPAALAHAILARSASEACDGPRRGRCFALAYFWGTFAFFTLSSSRRSYYLLPILPAAALLIARLLTANETLTRTTTWLLRGAFGLAGLMITLSAVALVPITPQLPAPWDALPDLPCPWAFASMWLVSMAAIAGAFISLSPSRIGAAFGVMAFAALAYLYLLALPATEIHRTQKPFADAVRMVARAEPGKLALYRTREIVFYLDWPCAICELHGPVELRDAMANDSPRWVILRRRDWEILKIGGTVIFEETVQPWDDADTAANKLLLVNLTPDS